MTYLWVGPVSHSWGPPATHEWVTSLPGLPDHPRKAVNEHARVSFRYNSLGLPVEERCDEYLIERSYDKNTDLSYLYGAVSEPSLAMSVMLMAS